MTQRRNRFNDLARELSHPNGGNPIGKVSMKPLKEWATRKLPSGSHLRQLILGESDGLEASEFLGRLRAWDGLAILEQEEDS